MSATEAKAKGAKAGAPPGRAGSVGYWRDLSWDDAAQELCLPLELLMLRGIGFHRLDSVSVVISRRGKNKRAPPLPRSGRRYVHSVPLTAFCRRDPDSTSVPRLATVLSVHTTEADLRDHPALALRPKAGSPYPSSLAAKTPKLSTDTRPSQQEPPTKTTSFPIRFSTRTHIPLPLEFIPSPSSPFINSGHASTSNTYGGTHYPHSENLGPVVLRSYREVLFVLAFPFMDGEARSSHIATRLVHGTGS